jgi:hypothetical protein
MTMFGIHIMGLTGFAQPIRQVGVVEFGTHQ